MVLTSDAAAAASGSPSLRLGADEVAATFSGRAKAARPALIDGEPGAVWAPGGTPRVAFRFTVAGGTVSAITILGDPEALAALDVEFLD